VHDLLEKNHFKVFQSIRKILTREEVLNLFYAYRNAAFYEDIKEHLMTSESEILLLVNESEYILEDPTDEHSEKIKLASPIQRWKQLIGDKDPAEAKAEPECLRAIFGID